MGWYGTFCGSSTREIKEAIEKDFNHSEIREDGSQFTQKIIHHSFSYGESYMAIEQLWTSADGNIQDKMVFAVVNLWRYSKKDMQVMVKTMEEDMGPYYTKAPAKLLKMLTEPVSDRAFNWRVTCWSKFKNIPKEYREYREEKKAI